MFKYLYLEKFINKNNSWMIEDWLKTLFIFYKKVY